MNKYIRNRIISVLLTVMMFAGCIVPMQLGVYAEGDEGNQNPTVQGDDQGEDPSGDPSGDDLSGADQDELFTVTFYDTIGQSVIKEEQVAEGSSVTAPDAPVYADYKFSGWSSEDYKNVTTDLQIDTVYTPRPAAPARLNYSSGYEKVYLSWTPVTSEYGKVYYQVRDASNKIVANRLTTTKWTAPFDPYPGDKYGRGTSGTAKTAYFRVYTYFYDPIDGKVVYSAKATIQKNIPVIHPMYVVVKAKRNAKMYSSSTSNKKVGTAQKGKYYVAIGGSRVDGKKKRVVIKVNGQLRYISSSDVKTTRMVYNSKTRYSTAQIESFLNNRGLTSKTNKLVWVNTYNQRVYLFTRVGGKWKIYYKYPSGIRCNTGLELTPYGRFWVSSKWKKKKTTGTRWWTIFHSVGIHQKLSNALGKPASGGCVRIPTADAKWFYYNVKKKTTIFVY